MAETQKINFGAAQRKIWKPGDQLPEREIHQSGNEAAGCPEFLLYGGIRRRVREGRSFIGRLAPNI